MIGTAPLAPAVRLHSGRSWLIGVIVLLTMLASAARAADVQPPSGQAPLVAAGSFSTLELAPVLLAAQRTGQAVKNGGVPDLFKPSIPVVLEGHFAGKVYKSDQMLLRHSPEYDTEHKTRDRQADQDAKTKP